MSVLLGAILHALGGSAAASFYIPLKKVKNWGWESFWLVSGVAAWLAMPWIIVSLSVPDYIGVIQATSPSVIFWTFTFGLLWGVGGLTFGLSMRYLGISLGYAVVLGFTAAFGTLVPPIFRGEFVNLLTTESGQYVLLGVAISLVGIGICGWAGFRKEKELSTEAKQATVKEFNLNKGIVVALFSGVMSACMAFGLASGKPLAEQAVDAGTSSLFQNNVVLVVVLAGGFLTNMIWCLILNYQNATFGDYSNRSTPLIRNYLFSLSGGAIWYLQFFFYGMGTTQMGEYDFASWSLHMSFIILFSNVWGIYLKEWQGTSAPTKWVIFSGLLILLFSVYVIGIGATLA